MFTKSHLRVVDTVLDDGAEPLKATGHDWAAVALRAKGVTLLVASIYLTTGWPARVNQAKLLQVAQYLLQAGGRPALHRDGRLQLHPRGVLAAGLARAGGGCDHQA